MTGATTAETAAGIIENAGKPTVNRRQGEPVLAARPRRATWLSSAKTASRTGPVVLGGEIRLQSLGCGPLAAEMASMTQVSAQSNCKRTFGSLRERQSRVPA